MGIYNVAVSGLNAAQIGILTTSHNIGNASTSGYNRQQIHQTTNLPMFTGAGYIGQGTSVETIQRVYNEQLEEQVLSAQTGASEMDSYLSQISQISNLLADPDAGLSPALSSFFTAIQEVSANPSSLPARQSMLSASESLVARFQSLDGRMREIRTGVNAQITSEIDSINSYAEQIADINQRIIIAQAAGPNQPPNDLLDQRDQLITDLNKEIRVTTLKQSDNTYSVFIGNGQPLVVGTVPYSMQAVAAPDEPERTVVALQSPTGAIIHMPESLLTGGALGGLLAFRSQSLDGAQNALGRIAVTIGQNINDQHRLGQDLTGAPGGDYFDLSLMVPTVRSNSNNAVPAQQPTVTISTVGNLTASDYRLIYSGTLPTPYTLQRLSDNTTQTYATLPQTVDGITIAAGGWTPVAGDSFLIQPTRGLAGNLSVAIGDPRAIAAAAPIRTAAALANAGTGSVSAGTVNAPPPPNVNLQQAVTITFDNPPGTFDVAGTGTGNPANVAYTSGGNITYNGWTIQISGTPAAGDVFTIGPNSNGVSDNRNALLMGAIQTQKTMEGGTASYQSAYSRIIADVGNKARQVEITGKAQLTLYEQARTTRDQLSGVNLDEEAANLIRYQQAYQASARIIDIARSLFDEILAVSR